MGSRPSSAEVSRLVDTRAVSSLLNAAPRPALRDANGSDSDIFVRDVGPRGDLTGDGCVDGEDLGILLLQWGEGCIAADLNFDGIVDEDDEDLLTGNYGGDCD